MSEPDPTTHAAEDENTPPRPRRRATGAKQAAKPAPAKQRAASKKTTAKKDAAGKTTVKKPAAAKKTATAKTKAPRRKAAATAPTAAELHALIAEAAYLRAEARGFQGGDPEADWLAAEAAVRTRLGL